MTNSDYLLKATLKKVTEKLNEIFAEKIEEATNIAQDAPEILKKEFYNLRESILEEAARMENDENTIKNKEDSKSNQSQEITNVLEKISEIDQIIEKFNRQMNNLI